MIIIIINMKSTPYNGIFSFHQIFAILSEKHWDYFSQILIFTVGNVCKK